MSFEEELKNTTNPWIKQIGEYLISREDIQENLKKENKSLDECFRFILNEIANQYRKNNEKELYVYGKDEEIYALAVHYYDEDDIKVPKTLNFVTNADESAKRRISKTNRSEDKKDMISDDNEESEKIKEHIQEKKKAQPKKKKTKKDKVDNNQLSLFDYLG